MQSQDPISRMVDVSFAVDCRHLALAHRHALSAALLEALPSLETLPDLAVHPLKFATAGAQAPLLSRRTRLILRVPREHGADLHALTGRTLTLGADQMTLGTVQERELLGHSSLYAHLVDNGERGELAFLAAVERELQALDIQGRVICGRHQDLAAEGLQGYSLMIDRVSPAQALRLMEAGMGGHRRLGCGVFVPHRSAVAVGS